MLKFWKKKPAEEAAEAPAETEPAERRAGCRRDTRWRKTWSQARRPRFRRTPTRTPTADRSRAAKPASWRERLAGSVFNRDIRTLFARNPKLDDALLDELETALISADVGVAASTSLVEDLRKRMDKREFADADALLAALRADLIALLRRSRSRCDVDAHKPVRDADGRRQRRRQDHHDRQARAPLQRSERRARACSPPATPSAPPRSSSSRPGANATSVPVIAQGSGADSASVIFDALQSARSRGIDVLIADTAGRLHTQAGLMDELAKIRRVLQSSTRTRRTKCCW